MGSEMCIRDRIKHMPNAPLLVTAKAGLAKHFLLDVLRQYAVLFVGCSHNGMVMNRLADHCAEAVAGRLALTDEDGSWDLFRI